MKNLDGIGGILFDLEGVLYVGNQAIDGAYDTYLCQGASDSTPLRRGRYIVLSND